MSDNPQLADAEYISLRSFKRDGSHVDTPVWCAGVDGRVVVFTLRESFKVKRIRRNPQVQVARCTMRGAPLGPFVSGTCSIVPGGDPREVVAYRALLAKYGWKMRMGDFFSTLTGRIRRRVILEIVLH